MSAYLLYTEGTHYISSKQYEHYSIVDRAKYNICHEDVQPYDNNTLVEIFQNDLFLFNYP